MKVGPSTRIGPDLQTEWGTYPSPIFTVPARNARVVEYLPPTIRGRHQFRTQPRNLSLLPTDPAAFIRGPSDVLNRGRSTLVADPDAAVAHGVGAVDGGSRTGLYIFLAALGLIGIACIGGRR
jgi:hypothetical protein